ncbi:threonine/homoserine/homoserine lactone efflux protein [Sphingomonas sp. BK345]|nr:threonine/homoserine/homoserine lactone efflux protein [Sphingomonas sp. BK345]
MALHTWWLFVGSVFLLSGTPGPNMLHVMSRSVQLGLRRSVAAMAG